MKFKFKALTLGAFTLLGCSACMGPQASFSEMARDSFIFTSASEVPASEKRCITVTKSVSLQSGSLTFSIPAGRYVATKKNRDGYFYYAPTMIKSSNGFISLDKQGIFLNNQLSGGNIFGKNPEGYSDRPIRGPILTKEVLSYINKNSAC